MTYNELLPEIAKYTTDPKQVERVLTWIKRGCELDTALQMEELKRSRYVPVSQSPSQPQLWEEGRVVLWKKKKIDESD